MTISRNQTLKVLVAEDEQLAAQALALWVRQEPGLELVGIAANGVEALALTESLQPQIILLDINMPGLNGLEVARQLSQSAGSEHKTAIVFTTAYDQHAITAFELQAVDYLLKPFSLERFREAVTHSRQRLLQAHDRPAMPQADSAIQWPTAAEITGTDLGLLARIMIRDQGKIFPVRIEEVEYLKSDTKYTAIAYRGRQFLVRLALQSFEGRLDRERFLKLQRSCIVNLDFVESMTPDDMSQLVIKMRDGSLFTASREVSKQLRSQSL